MSFASLNLAEPVNKAIETLGYETPSPIQARTIPLLLEGRDVVGLAQTGTGKTAAFALPVLSKLADADEKYKSPQVLVLAPTRELALQVAEAFSSYAANVPSVSVVPVYGGSSYGPQLAGLRRGAAIVVGTPGRVIDHLERGSLDLSDLKYLVLDEADEMLRMGFAEDVDRILSSAPENKQTALFSATMPKAIQRITGAYLKDPVEVRVEGQSKPAQNIRQRYLQVAQPWKLEAMTRLLETEETDGMIAFVRTRNMTEELTTKLVARGFAAAAISGDIPQNIREKTVEDLRHGRIDILVATDVAARGLDVERISHVVNYDIPHDTSSYVHRIGRTGRAGRQGDAILLMTPRERYLLRSIEKATKQPVEEMQLPTLDEVNASRRAAFSENITQTMAAHAEDQELTVYRDLVSNYIDEHDVAAVDIAAALALMAQDGRPLEAKEPDLPALNLRGRRKEQGAERSSRPKRATKEGHATYWIAVGHKDKVGPGNIVGAIANEGNLDISEIGDITIRPTFSLVELPEDLSGKQESALKNAVVAGRKLNLRLDRGAPQSSFASRGSHGGGFDSPERGQKKKQRWSKAKKRQEQQY
ncbi:MAG: DEAD/DEAH box helicase [Yaniella sp.]|uniref:DEAD/DEAH box helicase n=2 Tax=Yaniella sp. TaxID=2773929 RepID=UPI00264718F6|nr:DEAD/DEAH box helicase [Yaniella sp.]MDN5814515.1 DEAD/DEAH box helicase [Yaniella sp.]MDN5816858.1 DEAD/DEAH box helicase [Yaniella sp.]MDN5837088.1 DEAD/DEAH box helicase [Yaniella sp.]MDN5888325.1 DEAD/DEAH box helicase [Yaniella sp.]MDN5913047.1 DEAD/DEAH box helicase [Yaniella sp.]